LTPFAIGIVSFERGLLTQRLLDSISTCTATPHHVFIADNGSQDEVMRVLLDRWERRADTTVVRLAENEGPSAGRNAILERIENRFAVVAMLDNDIIVLPGWEVAALSALDAGYDAVDAKLLRKDGVTVDRGPTRLWKEPFFLHPEYLGRGLRRDAPQVNARTDVPLVAGTAFLRSEIFRKVGGYEPGIWAGEDYDLAYRGRAAGFRYCYEPRCEMIHDHAYVPGYDQVRSDPRRLLLSHYALWKRHRKLLLPPSALWLYTEIVKSREPMFLDRGISLFPLLRRSRRRLRTWYANTRYGEVWRSEADGAGATKWSETCVQ
jgi:GT2 family glycosyltransferase